ncbi:MAG: PqqD family protein [Acidimicrobiales bacterium]|nr:PqqD family protein [Acidimicrobiales bacterium]
MTNGGISKAADPERFYELADGVLTRKVGGEVLLLNTDSELYFSLNEVGSDFLQLLEEGMTVGSAIAKLATVYDAPIEIIANDIAALTDSLLQRGLIVAAH